MSLKVTLTLTSETDSHCNHIALLPICINKHLTLTLALYSVPHPSEYLSCQPHKIVNVRQNLALDLTSQSEPHCSRSTILTLPVPKHRNVSLALAHGLDRHGEHRHHPELTINMSLNVDLTLTLEANSDCSRSGILPISIAKHLHLNLAQDSAPFNSEFL